MGINRNLDDKQSSLDSNQSLLSLWDIGITNSTLSDARPSSLFPKESNSKCCLTRKTCVTVHSELREPFTYKNDSCIFKHFFLNLAWSLFLFENERQKDEYFILWFNHKCLWELKTQNSFWVFTIHFGLSHGWWRLKYFSDHSLTPIEFINRKLSEAEEPWLKPGYPLRHVGIPNGDLTTE